MKPTLPAPDRDARQDAGRDVLLALVREHDVVLEASRPGGLDRLRAGHDVDYLGLTAGRPVPCSASTPRRCLRGAGYGNAQIAELLRSAAVAGPLAGDPLGAFLA